MDDDETIVVPRLSLRSRTIYAGSLCASAASIRG